MAPSPARVTRVRTDSICSAKGSKGAGSRRRKEDELEELDDLDDEAPGGDSVRLEKQPAFISGGAMREYQVRGAIGAWPVRGGRRRASRRLPVRC